MCSLVFSARFLHVSRTISKEACYYQLLMLCILLICKHNHSLSFDCDYSLIRRYSALIGVSSCISASRKSTQPTFTQRRQRIILLAIIITRVSYNNRRDRFAKTTTEVDRFLRRTLCTHARIRVLAKGGACTPLLLRPSAIASGHRSTYTR